MWHMGLDVNPAAAPILIQLLNDDDERVRNEAAFAIGVIDDRADTSSAIPPLIAMLKGSRHERLNAASALCRLGERANAAIPALIEAREGDDPMIREIASEALHRIAPASFPANWLTPHYGDRL
jgi:HEAT repeat protein